MHSLRGKDAALQAVCAQRTFPSPFKVKMKMGAEISLHHFSEHKSLSQSIYQNYPQISSPVKILHGQKNTVANFYNLYSFRQTEYHGHSAGQAQEHLVPPHLPVLVRPGTCLTLKLEFEMLYKPITFTIFLPSPLARFLCLLTNPSCSYLN